MLPFVRFPRELEQCRNWVEEEGLFENPDFELWMMAEVPSNILLMDALSPVCLRCVDRVERPDPVDSWH